MTTKKKLTWVSDFYILMHGSMEKVLRWCCSDKKQFWILTEREDFKGVTVKAFTSLQQYHLQIINIISMAKYSSKQTFVCLSQRLFQSAIMSYLWVARWYPDTIYFRNSRIMWRHQNTVYEVTQAFRDRWVLMHFDDVTIFLSSENI